MSSSYSSNVTILIEAKEILKLISVMNCYINPRKAVAVCSARRYLAPAVPNSYINCASICSIAFVRSFHWLFSLRASTSSSSRKPNT